MRRIWAIPQALATLVGIEPNMMRMKASYPNH
jgi:hypothetical protein